MLPRVNCPTTSEVSHGHPQEPSRAQGASRSRVTSSCFGWHCVGGQNEPIFLDVSDCSETSSAAAERWSRTPSKAGPRSVQAAIHQAGRYRVHDLPSLHRSIAPHGQPWPGGENEPIFLDVSDCCKTSSAAPERWSRTRSEGGPRHAQAATHHEGRYRVLDRSRLDQRVTPPVRLGCKTNPFFSI
jgi:hypothetical protein